MRETIAKLSQRNYHKIEECDADSNILNVPNGFLDMDKMKLSPHSPDYLSITQFQARFEKRPKSKRITRLLI